MLLAYGPAGAPLRFDESNRERFASYRADCQESNAAFFDMLRAEHLTLATDQLGYFAHWITPEEQPLRFDTRFFVAMAPLGQEPDVSYAFKQAGFRIANLEVPAVQHIGYGRHIDDPMHNPRPRNPIQRLERSIRKRVKRLRRAAGL